MCAFELTGHYLNVNSVDDLNAANFLARSLEFEHRRVSVVIPAYKEAASIGTVIRDFQRSRRRDRRHGQPLARRHRATSRATSAPSSTRGRSPATATRAGRASTPRPATSSCWSRPTARSARTTSGKLLEYLKDADMVIGTRTTRQMIQQGANMDGLLRWGNVAVGKIVEALWWELEPRLTDVGCTYRALWRDCYLKIRPYLGEDGPAFSPEMMIEVLRMEGRAHRGAGELLPAPRRRIEALGEPLAQHAHRSQDAEPDRAQATEPALSSASVRETRSGDASLSARRPGAATTGATVPAPSVRRAPRQASRRRPRGGSCRCRCRGRRRRNRGARRRRGASTPRRSSSRAVASRRPPPDRAARRRRHATAATTRRRRRSRRAPIAWAARPPRDAARAAGVAARRRAPGRAARPEG